jgi:hypothetical protein
MASVDCWIAASPAAVFSVLAQGWFYSNWVVGTSHVRAVDADWPEVGSRIHHATGVWPAVVRDETVVKSVVPELQLTLVAKGWPLGEARVDLELDAVGEGTNVSLHETPVSGPGKWLHNPLLERVLVRRNIETLARLKALVERHTEPDDGQSPAKTVKTPDPARSLEEPVADPVRRSQLPNS